MMRKHPNRITSLSFIRRIALSRGSVVGLIVVTFAILGVVLIRLSGAATHVVSLEAESGTLLGSTQSGQTTGASNSGSVKFGSTSGGGGGGGSTPNCDGETSGPLRTDTSFPGTTTGRTIPYSIVLPDDYYTACKEYPVLYSLHGKTQTNASYMDEALSIKQAVDDGVLPDIILITPDGYSDGRWQGDAEENVINDMIPFIESKYRVKKGPSYRLLTGFSMGGHGAFYYAVKYPKLFAATLAVDGAMSYTATDYTQYIDQVKASSPPIYSIGGQLNGSRVETIINAFKDQGVTMPYKYYDTEHVNSSFMTNDKNDGWPGVKTLADNLGRSIQ